MEPIPFFDLTRQFEALREDIEAAVASVFASQRFIGGPEIAALEESLSRRIGCAAGVGVSSGTDALLVSLMALGLGPGDEVITSPFSFFAPVEAILRVGARPVFVDIDPLTFNLDVSKIEEKITERTRAILPVHLFGQCADMTALTNIARARGLFVIEDMAQALDATHRGAKAGSFGELGCVSFFPTKNLGAAGDGGMVFCADEVLEKKVRRLGRHGAEPKYHHVEVGGNFRLDAIQAAILRVKLQHLHSWTNKRQQLAAAYNEALAAIDEVVTPAVAEENQSVFNQYVIRIIGGPGRDEVARRLSKRGVGTNIYYPEALHLQPATADLGYKKGDFPQAERACEEVLAMPIFPELTAAEQARVVDQLASCLGSRGVSPGSS